MKSKLTIDIFSESTQFISDHLRKWSKNVEIRQNQRGTVKPIPTRQSRKNWIRGIIVENLDDPIWLPNISESHLTECLPGWAKWTQTVSNLNLVFGCFVEIQTVTIIRSYLVAEMGISGKRHGILGGLGYTSSSISKTNPYQCTWSRSGLVKWWWCQTV